MQPMNHQLEFQAKLWQVLVKHKFAYLAGLPRSGKTLTSLLTLENSKRVKSVLILTKKNAISGWTKFITDPELTSTFLTKEYTVTNYEAIGSFVKRTHHATTGKLLKRPITESKLKLSPDDYDAVILDEAHTLGKLGKPSNRYLLTKLLVQDKPFIALSGTATVESPMSIYYQMSTSTNTPFPQPNFYRFHDEWGIPATKIIGYKQEANDYSIPKPELQSYIDSWTIYMTQADAGIDESVQAKHELHYVTLTNQTKVYYNQLQSDRILNHPKALIIANSIMKLRTSLHMLESGITKVDDEYIELGNTEKIDYIKQNFTITSSSVILAHYIGEQQLLQRHFPNATIASATSNAEGVDYSHADHFIIFSSGYSGSKFIQRNERNTNVNNQVQPTVHHILVKSAISDQVYQVTSQKNDFNNQTYQRNKL